MKPTVYRLITRKLRVHPAQGPHREYERPSVVRRDGSRAYTDVDDPTLVELYPDDRVDVAGLLKIGAIEPYTPPKRTTKKEPGTDV